MKIRTNDKVKIIAGKDKGTIGTVLKVFPVKRRLVVEGVNRVKKHIKPGTTSEEGGIISIEKPIDSSNVMYYDETAKETTRIGFKFIDGKKYRMSKKTGEIIDKEEK